MIVQPIVTVPIYFFIFQLGFKSAPPVPGVPYVLVAGAGYCAVVLLTVRHLNCVTGCLQEYSYLVKKVVFQVEILPVIKLISCSSGSCILRGNHVCDVPLLWKNAGDQLASGHLLQFFRIHAGTCNWIFHFGRSMYFSKIWLRLLAFVFSLACG